MALPSAVKKQAEKAEQLIKENKDRNTGTPPTPIPASPPASPSPTPAAPVAAAPPPAPPVAAPPPASDEWKQKYEVLQGKYNAEVPKLHENVKQMQNTVQKLQKDLETAKAAPTPPPQPAFEAGKYVKKEDIEEYTPEMTTFIRSVAREELEGNISAVLEKLLPTFLEPYLGKTLRPMQETVQSIATRVETREAREFKSTEDKFFDSLEASIKSKTGLTFEAINTHPSFLGWLSQKDPRSRRVRQELLDEARSALDAEWAASFFSDFVTEHPNTVVASVAPIAVPDRMGGGGNDPSNPDTPKGRIWKRSDITAFYADVSTGKYKGRDQEKQQIETDIYAARKENRIVDG